MANNPNGSPELPVEDRIESRQLTVASLAADCVEFAELDEEFLNRERIKTSVSQRWERVGGTIWQVGFTAVHCFEDKRYIGQSYALDFMVSQKLPNINDEIRNWAADTGCAVPDKEYIVSIAASYSARFLISQYVTLGWSSNREYQISHTQSHIHGLERQNGNELEDEESADRSEDRRVIDITLGFPLEYHEAPEVSDEMLLGDSYKDTNVEKELIECLDLEMHLHRAKEVLAILQSSTEGSFDLASVLPSYILGSSERHKE